MPPMMLTRQVRYRMGAHERSVRFLRPHFRDAAQLRRFLIRMGVQRLTQLCPHTFSSLEAARLPPEAEKRRPCECRGRDVGLTQESKRHWLKVPRQSQIEKLKL